MQSTVVKIAVDAGDAVDANTIVVVLEAMKMEHAVPAGVNGFVRDMPVAVGDTVLEGDALLVVEEADVDIASVAADQTANLAPIRADLAEVLARQELTRAEARPDAVERRRRT
ncbi:MAG: hypothetical protein QOI55_1177, partial [Actinomycetota bacterium]|nr:hypothetical protein [Actinomycetota bacterium]